MYLFPGSGAFLLSILFVASAILVVLDMRRYSDELWARANEPKNVWYVVGTVAAWPIGMAVYFFVVRSKLEALLEEDKHKALKERMFSEWREEWDQKDASPASGAQSSSSPAAPTPPAPERPMGSSERVEDTTVIPRNDPSASV